MPKVVGIHLPDAVYADWSEKAWINRLTLPMWIRRQVEANQSTAPRSEVVKDPVVIDGLPMTPMVRESIEAAKPGLASSPPMAVMPRKIEGEFVPPSNDTTGSKESEHPPKCTCKKCQKARGWRK